MPCVGDLQPHWCHGATQQATSLGSDVSWGWELSAAPVVWGHIGGGYLLGDVEGAVPAALVADQQVLGERTAAAR